jgi:uncharacterized protein YdaU (DUF1376 family)
MTPQNAPTQRPGSGLAYAAAVIGALLIVALLVWTMQRYTQPAPLNAARAAERAKALAELRAQEHEALTTTAWIDQGKGLVRLRIEDAIKLTERAWRENPAAARSNLVARVQKATAQPPKPPQKPSEYE